MEAYKEARSTGVAELAELNEYFPHIGSRHKWFSPQETLKEGDIVIGNDPNAARKDWKLGEFFVYIQAVI